MLHSALLCVIFSQAAAAAMCRLYPLSTRNESLHTFGFLFTWNLKKRMKTARIRIPALLLFLTHNQHCRTSACLHLTSPSSFFTSTPLSTTAFTETASERAAKCASLLHFTPLNFGLELLSRPRQEQRVHFSSNHRTLHTFIPSLSARLHLVSILGCL